MKKSINKNSVKQTKKGISINKKSIIDWFKTNNRNIYFLLIGIAIGFSLMFLFVPERIAKLKNGEEPLVMINDFTITADEYYETLKDSISVELLIQDIDRFLLNNLYETTKSMKKEINNKIEKIISEYTSYYHYTEKQFFEENDLKNRETFFDLLLIDHKRNLYYEDYLKKQITDQEIKDYYNNINPDMEIKYIISEDKKIADSIIKELNNGKSYNHIIKNYKSNISYQNYGYVAFDNKEIDTIIKVEAGKLKANTYSQKYLTIDDGYVIIFKGNEKKKENLNTIKKRIINQLLNEKKEKDSERVLYYKALIELREENNITFKDTVLEKEYELYINQYQ